MRSCEALSLTQRAALGHPRVRWRTPEVSSPEASSPRQGRKRKSRAASCVAGMLLQFEQTVCRGARTVMQYATVFSRYL